LLGRHFFVIKNLAAEILSRNVFTLKRLFVLGCSKSAAVFITLMPYFATGFLLWLLHLATYTSKPVNAIAAA
jgi:hypothetical protein